MLPSISIVIPVLNSERVLQGCLESIRSQDYPAHLVEVIIADGGSKDRSLDIAREYNAKIFQNPLKTGEAGKAVGLKKAQGDLVAFIDSDNLLPQKDWLLKMTQPFEDKDVLGAEPWEFTYRSEDGFIDRYCALLGVNDPICFFFGNYDKRNLLSGVWTELPIQQDDQGNWIKVTLSSHPIPTIGANGTIFRRQIMQGELAGDYFFDIDILACFMEKHPIHFAKVKIGIIHLFCGNSVRQFMRKQKRRIRDYLYYNELGVRKYPWKSQKKGLFKFLLSCFLVFPLIVQSFRGYFKKKDNAWFFHPLACWLTFIEYGSGTILNFFGIKGLTRNKWKQ